jgi:hypothetical protein
VKAPLVVRPRVARITALYAPGIVVFGLMALSNLVLLLRGEERGMPTGLRISSLILLTAAVLLQAHALRVAAFSGAYLAADQDRVWLRAGGIRRPRVVVLPWDAIQDVRLHGSSRSFLSPRFICLDAPSIVDEANGRHTLSRYMRSLRRVTGTPFAVDIRHAHGDGTDVVARLKKYATASVTR